MSNALTTASVLSAFSQEITAHGGTVSNVYHDEPGGRLFVRSILPQTGDVQPRDRLQGGVALKAHGNQVSVFPYVFRLVCQNGAIMAHSLASRRISMVFEFDPEQAVSDVREAVAICSAADVFTSSLSDIRTTLNAQADLALNLLAFVDRVPPALIGRIMERFFHDGDESRFGLMNAITAIARDATNPETKWDLEELGGGIALPAPNRLPKTPHAKAVRRRELVAS